MEKIENIRKKEINKEEPKIDINKLTDGLETFIFKEPNLIEALVNLVIKLESKLPNYDTILSDDASGRLVSLMLRKIIKNKRAELKKKPPQIFFLATGRHSRGEEEINLAVNEFISKKSKKNLGKTLLVTEFIFKGKSISSIIEILNKNKVDFDLAAVSILRDPATYQDLNKDVKNIFQNKFYYGQIGDAAMDIYKTFEYSGVYKDPSKTSPFPSKYSPKAYEPYTNLYDPSYVETVNQTRKDIKVLADRLSDLII